MKRWPKLPSHSLAGGFMAIAATLSVGCLGIAAGSFFQGDLEQALLMTAVAVFAGWLATAILQFQRRMSGIDEVVRQARQKVQQVDQSVQEMRQLAQRLRGTPAAEDSEEDRTIH
jgi:hypothetical protein